MWLVCGSVVWGSLLDSPVQHILVEHLCVPGTEAGTGGGGEQGRGGSSAQGSY